jgi:hypothetical protein
MCNRIEHAVGGLFGAEKTERGVLNLYRHRQDARGP